MADSTDAARARPAGIAARRVALALVSAVLDDRVQLDHAGETLDALTPADRARAGRLARAALRHHGAADTLLRKRLRKSPPPRIRHILTLATVEICAEGGAAHGVVDAAVALVRDDARQAGHAGLVNAVLRRVAADGPAEWAALAPQRLPGWLRGRLQSAWGSKAVAAMEAAHAAVPPVDLTARDDTAALAEAVGGTCLPTGSVRVPADRQVTALPGFDDGAFWVQDAAAALPARMLAVRPGEKVLDLCAAPGGKTLQLAAAGASVTALDISEPRLARLHENLARTGLSAEIVTADALTWDGGPFDAILLDAPCTATGTIRRHPDLPFIRQKADIAALTKLQADLIDRARMLLRPGGRLVYCTCSLLPEEGEAQVDAAVARHGDLHVDDAVPYGSDAAWRVNQGLRLRPDHWPDLGGIDGFFIATLRRDG